MPVPKKSGNLLNAPRNINNMGCFEANLILQAFNRDINEYDNN